MSATVSFLCRIMCYMPCKFEANVLNAGQT